MKTAMLVALAAAALAAAADVNPLMGGGSRPSAKASEKYRDPNVSIKTDAPMPINSTEHKGDSAAAVKRTKTMTEIYHRKMHYSGSIHCSLRKGETATTELEAFYVWRGVGDNRTPPTITTGHKVGTYTFGDGLPQSMKEHGANSLPNSFNFEFTSPEYVETVTTKSYAGKTGRRRSTPGYTKKKNTGTKLLGVILRARSGAEYRVVSVPRNPEWERAGKMQVPTLEKEKKR